MPGLAQPVSLGTVVVTGTREPLPLDRITSDVVVISAQRIRDSSADSLEALLQQEAGVQVSRNGGPGQNASALIRGAGATSTVLLIDGVRVGSATVGFAPLEAISLAQIERIEVLRGPASSLYGADAVGGVVQIFTRRGDDAARVGAHVAVGQAGSSEAALSLSGATAGGFDYAMSLSREASDGISAVVPNDRFGLFNPDRDGFMRRSALLRLGYAPLAGHRIGASLLESRLNAQYDGAEFGPGPDFILDASPDFRNHATSRVASLDYRAEFTPQWTSTLRGSRNTDRLRSGGTSTDRFDSERRQWTWQNAWQPSPERQAVVALEHVDEDVSSNQYLADRQRTNNALVLAYSMALGAHSLQADWRHDRNSAYGNQSTGRLGWAVDLTPALRLRAAAATAFRAPTFNDLYYPGYGVATLTPERSRSIEAGLAWHAGASSAGITIYRNRVRDLINYEPDRSFCPPEPAYDFGCARNISQARLQGATLDASHRIGGWQMRATIDFLDATDVATGERLARRAANQASLHLDYGRGPWTLGAGLLHVGARPEGGARLAAYETLDLKAAYRFDAHWRLEMKLLNATDRHYQPALDYQALGRQAWIGLRFQDEAL